MRCFAKFITIICLIFCWSTLLCAQTDTSLVKDVNQHIGFIDSINSRESIENTNFKTFVDDGIIEINGKIVGGYRISTLTNSGNDTVLEPSRAANIPILISIDYKMYKQLNPDGNTKTFRVFRYKQLLS